jgi:hypothetical protein
MNSPTLPNFILAGAPSSGTTSLYHYLRQHPQIFMCPIKEPTFFAAEDVLSRADLQPKLREQRATLQAYLAGLQKRPAQAWVTKWDDYVRLFQDARDQKAVGEASVSYLWLPSAAPAIRRALPESKIIFVLRDPTERLFTSYLHFVRAAPPISFRDWVLEAMRQAPAPKGRMHSHPVPLDGGFYATHLSRYLQLFPRAQIRIFLFEDYRANAPAVLSDVFTFLGVNPAAPINMSQRHNATVVPRSPSLHRWRRRLFGNLALPGWLPRSLQQPLRQLYNRRGRQEAITPEDRQLVVGYYREELLRTQDLIGCDLSAWLR